MLGENVHTVQLVIQRQREEREVRKSRRTHAVSPISRRNVFCLPSFLKKRQFCQSFDSLPFCANVFAVCVRLRKYLFIYPERPFLWAYVQQPLVFGDNTLGKLSIWQAKVPRG